MITHIPLNDHPAPKRVLVVGGGDGGVLREIVKHDIVETAVLVEIDVTVPNISKKFLPHMAQGLEHPKVQIHIGDGFEYLASLTEEQRFDVIITDSSDPDGPAAALFDVHYYQLLYNALTPNGIVCTQASENVWLNLPLLKSLRNRCRKVFPNVEYAYVAVPTYTSGQLGLFVCSKNPNASLTKPLRAWNEEEEGRLNKYYNKEIHESSFVLPTWAKLYLEKND